MASKFIYTGSSFVLEISQLRIHDIQLLLRVLYIKLKIFIIMLLVA